jgi:hypothetical protein
MNAFFEVLLFFGFMLLMFFDVETVIVKFFDHLFQEAIEIAHYFVHAKLKIFLLFKLSISLFGAMLFGVNFDACGTKGKETLWIFAEVENELFGMKCTVFRLVDLFRHE